MYRSHHTTPPEPSPRLTGEAAARLVTAAAAGDSRSWDALVCEFTGLIAAIARAHRLSDTDAADVTQATWLKLLEHLATIQQPSRVGAWLATTARRECLRTLRVNRRHVLLEDGAVVSEPATAAADSRLLRDERDIALWEGVRCLRPRDQALLSLLMAEPSLPYQEISAVLRIRIGSIGPTRQRALERLRRELDGQGTLTLLTAA
jgi:RNA polymerase sigma factor (sigma-70 family)